MANPPGPREAIATASKPATEEPRPVADSPIPPVQPPEPPKVARPSTAKAAASLTRDPMLEQLLATGGPALKMVMAEPEKYRFQVLYGIVRDEPKASIERHGYRVDAEYFYPASSMKLPIALASYDRIPALRRAGKRTLGRDVPIRIHAVNETAEPFSTTLARETWRALVVSDNYSANRLLSFVGHREAHETLWSLGLKSTRIRAGFATGDPIDPAEVSPKIDIVSDGVTDEIAPRKSTLELPPTDASNLSIGQRAIVDGRVVEGPMSFAKKNAIRLVDLQNTLVRIMRPDLLPATPADAASKEDIAYLREALGTLPSQSGLAGFARNVVADYQLSPLLRGIERVRPRGRFEIYSKVGQAYGFLITNAYVVDKETSRSFFVTAVVYANPDETMNSDRYAYDTISYPALADVGEVISRQAFAPR